MKLQGLLDYAQEVWEGGERPRQVIRGLLSGDTQPLSGVVGEIRQLFDPEYMSQVKPMSQSDMMSLAMDVNPVMALSTKAVKAIPKTQYELAHEIAQKNAVEMLGLPPNNTAMDRANALGFKTEMPLYHGTAGDFNEFKLFEDPKLRTSGSEVGKLGVSTALNPELANEFASRAGFDGSNVMPLLHRLTKGASAELPEGVRNDQVWASVIDAYKDGYDSLLFNNYNTDVLKSQQFILHRNPEMLRSKFAAFDPARVNERDLLGYSTPEMLGLLGLLSGAGVGYAYNKKDAK